MIGPKTLGLAKLIRASDWIILLYDAESSFSTEHFSRIFFRKKFLSEQKIENLKPTKNNFFGEKTLNPAKKIIFKPIDFFRNKL